MTIKEFQIHSACRHKWYGTKTQTSSHCLVFSLVLVCFFFLYIFYAPSPSSSFNTFKLCYEGLWFWSLLISYEGLWFWSLLISYLIYITIASLECGTKTGCWAIFK